MQTCETVSKLLLVASFVVVVSRSDSVARDVANRRFQIGSYVFVARQILPITACQRPFKLFSCRLVSGKINPRRFGGIPAVEMSSTRGLDRAVDKFYLTRKHNGKEKTGNGTKENPTGSAAE